MAKEGSIVVVDDNKGILTALQMLLSATFRNVITLSSPNNLIYTLQREKIDMVLLDMNFTSGLNNGNEGLFWLKEIKKHAPSVHVVLFTAYAEIDLAVKGIKEGASDFIVKPWDNDKLLTVLTGIMNKRKAVPKQKQEENYPADFFWGDSPAMQRVRSYIEKVAKTDATILITGENGTGKGLLANEIHRLSLRNKAPMVHVDMGAITETLFESELFGHVKGAFTDARTDRTGKFEEANNGSLFLDEIGNLSYQLQSKLLTAIQQRSIVRVGSNQLIPVSARLICATNQNLQDMVSKSLFREDLLYRINTIHVEIPPLRERSKDIVPLAEQFIRKYATRYNRDVQVLTKEAKAKLTAHSWDGNIRELEHTMEKAVIICESETLGEDDFHLARKKESATITSVSTLEEMEKIMIQKSMDKQHGNLSAVASELGISRQTLYNKMKKYEL